MALRPGDQPDVAGPDRTSALRGRPQAAIALSSSGWTTLAGLQAWRAQQFGGSDTRWAADVVGKYEVTAGRLLDGIIANGTNEACFRLWHFAIDPGIVRGPDPACPGTRVRHPTRCGAVARTHPGRKGTPRSICRDHEFYRQQAGFMSEGPTNRRGSRGTEPYRPCWIWLLMLTRQPAR